MNDHMQMMIIWFVSIYIRIIIGFILTCFIFYLMGKRRNTRDMWTVFMINVVVSTLYAICTVP